MGGWKLKAHKLYISGLSDQELCDTVKLLNDLKCPWLSLSDSFSKDDICVYALGGKLRCSVVDLSWHITRLVSEGTLPRVAVVGSSQAQEASPSEGEKLSHLQMQVVPTAPSMRGPSSGNLNLPGSREVMFRLGHTSNLTWLKHLKYNRLSNLTKPRYCKNEIG